MKRPKPQGRNDPHIFDYSKIMENLYIGSDLCDGAKCSEHSKEFKTLGVNTELNLSSEKNEKPPHNISLYSWIPVVDGYAPSQKQLDVGSYFINQSVESGDTVYVHCKNGHGRSPTMVAAYLIRFRGKGVQESIDFIGDMRPEIHIEKVQKDALEKFAKKWSK